MKYQAQNPIQYLVQTPRTILHLIHYCVFSKSTPNSPSWRRYTFLRVWLRNRRFLPHPQKNWSPLPAAYTYCCNCTSICTHCTPYLSFVVMTTYNQRCVSKIYFQKIMRNVTRTNKFLNYIQSQTHP